MLQHSVMHTTAASVGQQGTHTGTHTHACAHTHTRMHTHIQTQTRANTHRPAHALTHTHAHTYKRTNTQAHTRAHKHTHTHTRSHMHMHMHAHVARVMGFAKFSAPLATLPHLSQLRGVVSHCLHIFLFFFIANTSSSLVANTRPQAFTPKHE